MSLLFSILMLLQSPAHDVPKKEVAALQSAVDAVAIPAVARLMQPSKATYLDGYGMIVTLEAALETPRNLFSSPASPSEVQASVARRRKDLTEKLAAFLKQRIATMEFIGPSESLAVAVYIPNYTPADVPYLPAQIVFTVKKAFPEQVAVREF